MADPFSRLSPACAVLSPGITTISPDRISFAMPSRQPGGRTSAASATASRRTVLSVWRCNAGHRLTSAATGSALTQRLARLPLDHTRRLGSLDRLFRPVERAENSPFDQCAPAVIDRRERLRVHDLFGKLSRCQWSGSIAQHVVDQTQTLTRTEPSIVGSRLPGSDLFRRNQPVHQSMINRRFHNRASRHAQRRAC